MKFVSAFKYHLSEFKKPLIVFYIIIYSIVILTTVPELFFPPMYKESTISGLELASIIFLFVCCLNSFKSHFKMLLVNGVSRKTMFKSYLTTVAVLILTVAIIDTISSLIFSSISNYKSLYFGFYYARYRMVPEVSLQVITEGFIWRILAYAVASISGFIITLLYYRMDKPLKLAVSIGVPVLFFMIIPFINNYLLDGEIEYFRERVSDYIAGYGTNPYTWVMIGAAIFVVLSILSYLLMRRATVKE